MVSSSLYSFNINPVSFILVIMHHNLPVSLYRFTMLYYSKIQLFKHSQSYISDAKSEFGIGFYPPLDRGQSSSGEVAPTILFYLWKFSIKIILELNFLLFYFNHYLKTISTTKYFMLKIIYH
jgi:hypothetical protein